jgi:hypothetical protein
MEPEGSLPCSQQSGTGPCHVPDTSSPHFSPYLPKICSNIIVPSTPAPLDWFLPFRPSDCMQFSHLRCVLQVPPISPFFFGHWKLFGDSAHITNKTNYKDCISFRIKFGLFCRTCVLSCGIRTHDSRKWSKRKHVLLILEALRIINLIRAVAFPDVSYMCSCFSKHSLSPKMLQIFVNTSILNTSCPTDFLKTRFYSSFIQWSEEWRGWRDRVCPGLASVAFTVNWYWNYTRWSKDACFITRTNATKVPWVYTYDRYGVSVSWFRIRL